jgi:uncharacterized membrane protein YgdD (TMEM256/DUF423 family)
MQMSHQEEELSRRLHAARVARLSAQKTRLLALERAEKLERELKAAADTGVQEQIYRTLAARSQLQAVVKRQRVARYARIAALGLTLFTGGLAWMTLQNSEVSAQTAREAPLPGIATGDRLKLAYSYDVSSPGVR